MNRPKLGLCAALLLVIGSCDANSVDPSAPQFGVAASITRVELSYDTTYTEGTDTAQLHSFTQTFALTAKAYAADNSEVTGVRFRWSQPNASAT